MTREEQTDWLCRLRADLNNGVIFTPWNKEFTEALTSILEQEPCTDAISRQIISDYVESHIQEINTGYGDLNKHTNEILRMIVDYIESMPPVTPAEKVGWWIPDRCDMYTCSKCNHTYTDLIGERYGMNFCPNCGAKMQEVEE